MADEDSENKESRDIELPALVSRQPKKTLYIPELPEVSAHQSEAEINRTHLQMSNLELQMIYHALPQVTNVHTLTKLIETSMKAVKHQRDLLLLPYGHRGSAERKDLVFPPLEDG